MPSKPPRKDEIGPPSQFAQTPPTQPQDFSYLEMVMELQKSMAQMTEKVNSLCDASKRHDEKLDKISHEVFAAKVVVYIFAAIASPLLIAGLTALGKHLAVYFH